MSDLGMPDLMSAVERRKLALLDPAALLASLAALQAEVDSLRRNALIHLRNVVPDAPGANPYVIATAYSITLPDDLKCGRTFASVGGWLRAGGVVGPIANIVQANTAPGSQQSMAAPTGDLLFAPGDVPTLVDLLYIPERQDKIEATFAVTPGTGAVLGLPSGLISIMEAEALTGGVTGKLIVQVPAASAPSTRLINLKSGKDGAFCCASDAITSVRLKLGVIPAVNL